jgi:N-acetylmuramoyl-L-alanine amidase
MTYANLFKVWATVLAAIVASILLSVAALTTGAGAQEQPLSGKTVVIDPGHGGSDVGATYTFSADKKLYEKDQNLDVAYRLKNLLKASGATVYMTRGGDSSHGGAVFKDPGDDCYPDDATLSNSKRYVCANSLKADHPGTYVLVSIHMNGSTNKTTDYTTTLFGKWQKDKALANAVFGGVTLDERPSYGLRTLTAVNGNGTQWGTIGTRTPYQFASGVLLKSNMPATIAETVFITNTNEANQLADPTAYGRQQQIAEALKTGIEHYLATH